MATENTMKGLEDSTGVYGQDEVKFLSDEEFPDFCCEMKHRTKAIHDASDRLVNLKLAVVVTDVKMWAHSIAEFYHVFRTLEDCVDRTDHTLVGSFNLRI